MPITQSAVKRARQNPVRQARLLPYKTHMKTMLKNLAALSKAGKKADAIKLLPIVYKSIDVACKKNIIHRNTADRKKSLAARLVK